MKYDLIKRNKSRKSKCDFIAKELDERNIEWHFKDEGGIFKFMIDNNKLLVSHNNIVLEIDNQKFEMEDGNFWEEFSKFLSDKSTLK